MTLSVPSSQNQCITKEEVPTRRNTKTVKHRRVAPRRLNILSREVAFATPPTDVIPRSIRFPLHHVTEVIHDQDAQQPVADLWYTEEDNHCLWIENMFAITVARAYFKKNGCLDSKQISLIGLEQHVFPDLAEQRRKIVQDHVRSTLRKLGNI